MDLSCDTFQLAAAEEISLLQRWSTINNCLFLVTSFVPLRIWHLNFSKSTFQHFLVLYFFVLQSYKSISSLSAFFTHSAHMANRCLPVCINTFNYTGVLKFLTYFCIFLYIIISSDGYVQPNFRSFFFVIPRPYLWLTTMFVWFQVCTLGHSSAKVWIKYSTALNIHIFLI